MTKLLREWLARKWFQPRTVEEANLLLAARNQAYANTFETESGRIVMQHLLDTIYCTVYEGTDPVMLAAHNARRTVIHELLENIDRVQNPGKYEQGG